MLEEKDYTKHIMNERTTKSFSTDMQTLGMIKDFMEKYHSHSLSEAIDDLVNIGLANLGYRTEKEIEERLKGTGLSPEKITVPTPASLDIARMEQIGTLISYSQHERMRVILDIIKRLCTESIDNSATRGDIINEAEIQGIEPKKVEETLDRLNRNGQIYEPERKKYRISGD